MEEENQYYDDLLENSLFEVCPKCDNSLDYDDYDFQQCSKCGWLDT